MHVE